MLRFMADRSRGTIGNSTRKCICSQAVAISYCSRSSRFDRIRPQFQRGRLPAVGSCDTGRHHGGCRTPHQARPCGSGAHLHRRGKLWRLRTLVGPRRDASALSLRRELRRRDRNQPHVLGLVRPRERQGGKANDEVQDPVSPLSCTPTRSTCPYC